MTTMAYEPLQPTASCPGLSRGIELLCTQKRPRGLAPAEQPTTDPREAKFALQYLEAFGYLAQLLDATPDLKAADLIRAVKQFQTFFGLRPTGVVCAKVVRAMEAPRCGCPDIDRPHLTQHRGLRAWARAMLPAWRKRSLTYAITDYVPGLKHEDVDAVVAHAFAAWTQYGNLEVAPVRDAQGADIVLSTGSGPRSNFDGPGGTLAWAYLPDGNDQPLLMKFDLGETWVLNPAERGILLMNVCCHELGHALGLEHSRIPSALMAPYYSATTAVPQRNDDIARFQVRYGVRATPPPPTPTPGPTPTPAPGPTRIAIEGNAQVWLNNTKIA